MSSPKKTVLIVGGGISGLAAAYFVRTYACLLKQDVEVKVIEARNRLGGVIGTTYHDKFVIEEGPDSFITDKPFAFNLAVDLGLEREIITTRTQSRKVYVLRQGRLVEIPSGFFLLGPSRLLPLLKSPVLSLRGKVRAGLDLFLPAKVSGEDESVASFVRRRFGQEVLEHLVQPLCEAVYGISADVLSLKATFPRFVELEERYRSVILGLRLVSNRNSGARNASGARVGMFMSFQHGMSTLINALERSLVGCVRREACAARLARSRDGWVAELTSEETINADAVILAVPAYEAARLLSSVAPRLADLLGEISYASATLVTMAYRIDGVVPVPEASGFVIPKSEGRQISACTFSSIKFDFRAPPGYLLIRAFIGRESADLLEQTPNDEVINMVVGEVAELLGLREKPVFAYVHRHRNAMPKYVIGHLERVRKIEQEIASMSGLALAGAAYRGIGIPDCIRSAQQAAQIVLRIGQETSTR